MKTSLRIRILTMSLVALVAFGFVSNSFAISMNYTKIMWTRSDGKTGTADINKDGTFFLPGPIPAGTYTFSLIASGPRQTTSVDGPVGTAKKSPGGVKGWSSTSSGDAPMESVSISKIALTMGIISPRDPASGLPTGKRQHSDISITKRMDAASGKMAAPSSADIEIGSATFDEDCNGVKGKIVMWDQKGKVMAEDSWQQ